jgi:hypothetical protein
MITQEEYVELRRLLIADLSHLATLVITHNRPVVEASIRSASVILRRWLIEDKLAILANAVQATPTVPVLDTSAVFAEIARQPTTEYFLTGGVYFAGTPRQGICSFSSPAPEEGWLLPIDKLDYTMLRLHQFKSQPRMHFKGINFSCEEIIKYTANKLGGVHIDFSRQGDPKYAKLNDKYAKLDEAASYMRYGGPLAPGEPQPSELYLVLEPKGSEVLSGAHIEIIAAAASLLQVHFDGRPIMDGRIKKTIRSQLRKFFMGTHAPVLFEEGKQLTPSKRDSEE